MCILSPKVISIAKMLSSIRIDYILLTAIVMSVILFWLFFVPFDPTKGILCFRIRLKSEKKDIMKRLRRSRCIGLKELPPPYPNGWYSILESSALKPQNLTYVSCLGEHFVVFRTQDGQVNVLDAYCPHLGANMGIDGRATGDNFECPFHLWSFRGSDGTCVNIPYSLVDAKGIKVRRWICREVNDHIFVWYHSENKANQWEVPIIPAIENKQLVFQGRNEFHINCHIQEIPENAADLAHFDAIHKAFVLNGNEDSTWNIITQRAEHHWQTIWSAAAPPKKHLASLHLKHSFQIIPNFEHFILDVDATQIGPSYVHLHMESAVFGSVEIIQTVTPVEPLVQKVTHRFYAKRACAPFAKIIIFAETIMFERDIAMWNNKMYRSKPQLVKEDVLIRKFRSWFSQFYTENSKSFTEACGSMNW